MGYYSNTPKGYADAYTPTPTYAMGNLQTADSLLRQLEEDRFARQKQFWGETQNYDQYLRGVTEDKQRRDEAAGLDLQRQLAGLNPNPVQSGPILTETINPGGFFSGARGPRVITGGLTPYNQQLQSEYRDKLLAMLDQLTGQGPKGLLGVDYDAILNSMNADMTKHYANQRNQMAERYAGLGRSMASTAASEGLNSLGEMEGRQGLANRAEVEKLRQTGNNYYNTLMMQMMPSVLSMLAKITPGMGGV